MVASLLIASLAGSSVPIAVARGADADQRVEQFLARLGLVDLQILQLERTLQSDRAAPKRPAARRLADLYAGQLMASSDNKARYDDTLQRIGRLLADYPEANTTALQVILLQADYNRAETLIAAWISDPGKLAARDEARDILTRISPQLVRHHETLNKQVVKLAAEADEMEEGDLLQAKELELRRMQRIAARATYFAAWSNYYLALGTDAAPKADPYVRARDIFRGLLGLEEAIPQDMEAEWLGLESIWRARALIGLGLSEAACGDLDASDRCFDLIEHASTPPEIKDQAPYWHLRALLQAGAWDRATTYAREKVAYFQPPASQGKVSFCVALVRVGFGSTDPKPTSKQRNLGNLGLNGLARLGQLGALNKLLEKYQINADKGSGFVPLWAAGQQKFAAAEKSKSAADYAAAAAALSAALKSPDANALTGPASRCRYTLAWCYYRQGEFERAAKEFASAFTGLEAAKDALAVESAWMTFAAYRRLAEKQPRYLAAATDAIKRLQRSFPDHPYAKRADYELARLMQKSDPAEMIRRLEKIQPDDANYAQARFDICLLRYRMWKEARADRSSSAARRAELQAAASAFLNAKGTDAAGKRKLKCSLLVADAALHDVEPRADIAADVLNKASRWAAALPDEDPLASEYHYRRLELAAQNGDQGERRRQAQWLADHATGSPYELAALLIVANSIERDVRSAPSGKATALNEQAHAAYRRLVTLLGDSPKVMSGSRNAEIAHSKLAYYAEQLGKHAEAADVLDKLLILRPRDRRYLSRAARTHAAAGQHDRALVHWRTLLLGLPKNSDAWYEAKYSQLQSLAATNQKQARKVFRQLKLLHPELGGDSWRTRFLELAGRYHWK